MQKCVNIICSFINNDQKVVVIDLDDVAAGKKRAADVEAAVKRVDAAKKEKKAEAVKKEKRVGKKAAKDEKAKTQAKKAVAAGEKKTGVDKCGRREGTQGFKINTFISKAPKSVDTLAKETKLPKLRITNHLRDMVGKGFVKKTDKGEYCWAA